MVALVISQQTNLLYPEVLDALTLRLSDRGIRVLLFALRAESDIGEMLGQMLAYQVDGAIVAARLEPAHIAEFAARSRALVLYNRTSPNSLAASVSCDFAAGERVLVDGLITQGRCRFGVIGGPADSAVVEARVHGALDRLADAGFHDVPFTRGDFSYEQGSAAARELLADHSLDALICANDTMALGAIDLARFELGLTVPEALAIVGFDGVGPTRWRSHRLTTVRQPLERMADAAVEMLIARILDPELCAESRTFPGELIVGDTAGL